MILNATNRAGKRRSSLRSPNWMNFAMARNISKLRVLASNILAASISILMTTIPAPAKAQDSDPFFLECTYKVKSGAGGATSTGNAVTINLWIKSNDVYFLNKQDGRFENVNNVRSDNSPQPSAQVDDMTITIEGSVDSIQNLLIRSNIENETEQALYEAKLASIATITINRLNGEIRGSAPSLEGRSSNFSGQCRRTANPLGDARAF